MKRNLLRDREGHGEERVGFIELFFDLVFVFAVTQVSHSLIEHPDLAGFVHALMMLLAIWWVWVDTAWVTNWLDVRHMEVRLLLFALMAAGMLLAVAIPYAFGARAWLFVAAYLAAQLGRHFFMILALGGHSPANFRNFVRIFLWGLLETPFWIGGAMTGDPALRTILWAAALSIVTLAPILAFWVPGLGRSQISTWNVEGHHFSERCGLFIIIALGESVLVTGAAFAAAAIDSPRTIAFASAFIGTVAMWWLYFDVGAERAARRLAQDKDPGRMARLAYTYFHIPIVAGIIVTAASDEMALAHPEGKASLAAIVALLGGPALYLAGNLLFKRTSGGRYFPLSHMVGVGLLAVAAAGAVLWRAPVPFLLSLIGTSVLIIVAGWEMISLRETRKDLKP
jgi:low temperature requirement protein LtrA